jgi:hypothetical protein
MSPTESKTDITAIFGKLMAVILILVAWNLFAARTAKLVNHDNLPRKSAALPHRILSNGSAFAKR